MRLTNIIEYTVTVTVYCVAIFWTNVVTLAIIFKYTRTVFLQITYTICYDGKMMSVLNRELDLHVVGLRCPADTDAANIREQVTRSEGRRQEMSSGKWVTARRRRRRRLNIHSRLRLQGKYAPDYRQFGDAAKCNHDASWWLWRSCLASNHNQKSPTVGGRNARYKEPIILILIWSEFF